MTDVNKNLYYVYLHRRKSDNKVFYVGKGKGNRLKSLNGRNSLWKRIVNKHGFISEIVFCNLSEQEAFDLEKDTILEMKYHFEKYLCNMTEGGEGCSGTKQSQETIQKRVSKNTGKKRTEETKLKLSKAMLGKKHSKETIAKLSLIRKGKKRKIEAVIKTALSNTGKKRTDKFCKEQSERAKVIAIKTKLSERTKLRNMDKTIYVFKHEELGEFIGTRLEFCAKYNIKSGRVSNYFSKKQKTVLGWVIRRKDDN